MFKCILLSLLLGSVSSMAQANKVKVRGNLVEKGMNTIGQTVLLHNSDYQNIDFQNCKSGSYVTSKSYPELGKHYTCNKQLVNSYTLAKLTEENGMTDVKLIVSQADCADQGKPNSSIDTAIYSLQEMVENAKSTLIDHKTFYGKGYMIDESEPMRPFYSGAGTDYRLKLLVVKFATPEGSKYLGFLRNTRREFFLYAENKSLDVLVNQVQAQLNLVM